MVCDNEPDEDELIAFTRTALKSKLAIKLYAALGSEVVEDDSVILSQDTSSAEDGGVGDRLSALLEDYDADATQNIINNVKKAWGTAHQNNNEYILIDLIADKIGTDLSSYVLASCLDTAASDSKLQDEERFVLARFAVKWEHEDDLCDNLQSITGKPWSIQAVEGKQMLVMSDDTKDEQKTPSDL